MDMLQEDQDTLERLKAKYNSCEPLYMAACMLDGLLVLLEQAVPALFVLLQLQGIQRWPRTQLLMFIVKVNPSAMLLPSQCSA
jgi:hypothetical protein